MARSGRTRARWIGAMLVGLGVAIGIAVLALPRTAAFAKRVWAHVDEALLPHPPSVAWPSARPEAAGLRPEAVERLLAAVTGGETHAFLLARGGRIVTEWYAPGYSPNRRHGLAAAAKGVIGSLALALATDLGVMDPDDPVERCIPGWSDRPDHADIRIRHLASHSSGIEDVPFEDDPEGRLPGWMHTYFRNRASRYRLALESARVREAPGTRYRYSGTGFYVLAYCLTRTLEGTPYATLGELLRERAMEPLGIPDDAWSISYGEIVERDGLALQAIGSGAALTARAAGRIGQLYLQEGVWEGRVLLRPETVREHVGVQQSPTPDRAATPRLPAAAFGWSVNRDGNYASLPRDAYFALGHGAQVVLVVPSWDLVAVRFGASLDDGGAPERRFAALEERLFAPIAEAMGDAGARRAGAPAAAEQHEPERDQQPR